MRTRHATFFTAFLVVGAWLPSTGSAQPAGPGVLVLLQNDAGVPTDVALKAQAEVVRLYALIGVEVAWVTEVPQPGRRVRVVCLVTWEPSEATIPATVLGLTYYRSGEAWVQGVRLLASGRASIPEVRGLGVQRARRRDRP